MSNPQNLQQYDFLNEYNTGQPRRMGGGGMNKRKAMFFMAVVGVVLVILFFVVSSLFRGGEDKNGLLALSAQQDNLHRWSAKAETNSRDSSLNNSSLVLNYVMMSDNYKLNKYLGGIGVKNTAKTVAPLLDKKTDEALDKAAQSGQFDTELREKLQAEMADYRKSLEAAHAKTESKKLKDLLSSFYDNTETLTF